VDNQGSSNLPNSATLGELKLNNSDEEMPKLYCGTRKELLQTQCNRLQRELDEKTRLMQMLKACNQETALGICDDIHLKYKEMQAQMDKTVVDLRSQRKQRLELERQQNKVVRYRQSRIQTLTRKLRQAKYDLQLVQAWNATHAQEVQLNYHTFQNPISWLLGDKPLFDRNTHKDGDGKNQLGYFIANRMVWVRTIGESEYRMGKILKVHPGIVASGKHHSHLHVAHEDDTYDILYDDGESETRVTKERDVTMVCICSPPEVCRDSVSIRSGASSRTKASSHAGVSRHDSCAKHPGSLKRSRHRRM